jgi:uncharacterized protein (TIGR03084 family)
LGVERIPRLRRRAHQYARCPAALRGVDVPDVAMYVALDAPDGSVWTWGDPDAADRVTGPALDFCLVTTQRRHQADTALVVTGPVAQAWMSIAQAYAGPPGKGRQPR